MILYPTTVLFRRTRAIEKTLAGLKGARPMAEGDVVALDGFEEIVGMQGWAEAEKRFSKGRSHGREIRSDTLSVRASV
jgi:hypothetical protein